MAAPQTTLDNTVLRRGGYVARLAGDAADLLRCQHLRHRCFIADAGAPLRTDGIETDQFDALCDHGMVEDTTGALVACFRVLHLTSGAKLHTSYSAQYYDLERLSEFTDPMLELGRFCVDPDVRDPDVLRIAWGLLAVVVDTHRAGMLFGCSSFAGVEAAAYGQALDLLAAQHQAPDVWRPAAKAPQTVDFGKTAKPVTDRAAAMAQIPSLLKTYLTMGGWVSDHAVIDPAMNTLHVFTALEIAKIPPSRAAALRAIAKDF